jgi:hypothetical protein
MVTLKRRIVWILVGIVVLGALNGRPARRVVLLTEYNRNVAPNHRAGVAILRERAFASVIPGRFASLELASNRGDDS